MKILNLALLLLSMSQLVSYAQEIQSYGKVNISDLELKECSFEKDANAMVLFDRGDVYFDQGFDIILERHKRIKIFNEKAKEEANVRLEYWSSNRYEDLYDITAQTINLKDGKPVFTKVERKQIFRETIDKNRTAVVFTFPDVQAGSIIEFEYKWKTVSFSNFPSWSFQSKIPIRYTELQTSIPDLLHYKTLYRIKQEVFKTKNSSQSKFLTSEGEPYSYLIDTKLIGLKDVVSLQDEPYMTSRYDNLQMALFQLTMIRPVGGFVRTGADSWEKIATRLSEDEDFGLQFRKKLGNENVLISQAKLLKNDEQKIAFLFNEVKNSMKWNGRDDWYTNEGIPKAWEKKTGNATEINLILYRLLKQSGVDKALPMILSTRENGKVDISFPWLYQFNRTVVHISVDSTKQYILDASDKYNTYATIPDNLLNSFGLVIDKENKTHKTIFVRNLEPSKKAIYIQAEINPEGKMLGIAHLTGDSYNKINSVRSFKTQGEEKYKEELAGNNNHLKISDFKISGIDIDSIPLQEKIDFELELTGSEGDYIYFTPAVFSELNKNPFISENRSTNIDFGFNKKYQITAFYKVPLGYKVDVMPKNINIIMPDKSISFQRLMVEDGDKVSVRCVFDFKKSVYTIDEYPMLREYYKQVIELLNEVIVLKKS